jgi:cell division protein FtsI (penicillin-binding protein 3)
MNPRIQPPHPRTRLYVVLGMLGLASSALVVRAVDLQVVRKDFYQEQGDARYLRDLAIPVSRGTIFDRNGEPLAVSTPVESIWANPSEVMEHVDRLPELAKAAGLDEESLKQKLIERSDKEFIYLKRHLNPDDAQAILKLDIPGIASQREFKRYYPSGEIMAHVLGYTNIDDHGQEGLELAFDGWLAGKPGIKRVIRDRLGHEVENVELIRDAQLGRDLTISIDRRVQYLAYRELMAGLRDHHAKSGSMVVLNSKTGEIVAMVNLPSYNPNSRSNVVPEYRRNRAVTDVVEPGSTMKAITLSAALESGKWKPESKVDTAPGTYELYGHTIHDTHNHGVIDVTHVITLSSNIGAAKIGGSLPRQSMYDMFHRLGFGEPSGSGFPGESPGYLPIVKNWGPVEQATISYGYGLNVTPLQIARAYAAIANGGVLHQPTFVKGGGDQGQQALDPKIAKQILDMLTTVVSKEGTAPTAAVTNYIVAGKTGTSHQSSGGGYSNRYVSLFTGIVPVSDPELIGVVVIHDAGSNSAGLITYAGGFVSAPVFSKVMDGTLRLLDVPPDNVKNWYTGGPVPAAQPVPKAPVETAPETSAMDNMAEEAVP